MKITVQCADLSAAIKKAKGTVPRNSSIPILSNVLLTKSGSSLFIRGTDLDVEVTVELPANFAEEDGQITLPFSTLDDYLSKILRQNKTGSVSIEGNAGEAAKIVSGRGRLNLQTLDPADFPTLAVGDLPVKFTMTTAEFVKLIGRAQFAISTEETRYYLNGVYLHCVQIDGAPVLRAAATDGHRLARVQMPAPDGAAAMPGIIIPRSTVAEAVSLCAAESGEVAIELSATKISISAGNTRIVSKLIDGTFPDYARVIPQGNNRVGILNRAEAISVVDRVATVGDRGHAVKLSFSGGVMKAEAAADGNTATDEVEADYPGGADLDIGFNSRYVVDILSSLSGEKIRFELSDPGSPSIIRPEGDDSILAVLMPMRV